MISKKNIFVFANDSEWLKYCYYKAKKTQAVTYYNKLLPFKNRLLLRYGSAYFIKNLPFKFIWWPFLFFSMKLWKKNNLIIVHDWNEISKYSSTIIFLKKFAKIVYLFTNIPPVTGANTYGIYNNLFNYNAVFTYDKQEAIKRQYHHLILPYEPEVSSSDDNDILYDVFFVGQAKNRLDTIHFLYKTFTDLGLSCNFWITEVKTNQIKYSGIHYNQFLPYSEIINYIKHSSCIFDPIQSNSTGFTLRIPESVFFDKKLITTNITIENESFYNPQKIFIIKNITEVKPKDIYNFIKGKKINYSTKDKEIFSFDNFISSITNAL